MGACVSSLNVGGLFPPCFLIKRHKNPQRGPAIPLSTGAERDSVCVRERERGREEGRERKAMTHVFLKNYQEEQAKPGPMTQG